MIINFWNSIIDWFRDRSDRGALIRGFNKSANEAFIMGIAPTTLRAKTSQGVSSYRHEFSARFNTGFRIEVLSGYKLSKEEIIMIGNTVIGNVELVRRLVVLGWDTLEIHDDSRTYGCRWKLIDYANIGLSLTE
ncbi:MAG: hypothetical protein R3Y59_11105 [bacterium]